MTYDAHTPCPACPRQVRDLYAVGRRVLERERERRTREYEELHQALEQLRPFVEAHHENQLHAFSPELEGVREPGEPTTMSAEQRELLPLDARD